LQNTPGTQAAENGSRFILNQISVFYFRFYDCVMSAPVTSGQPVLQYLQQTFAFLRHSMRSIYSPAEFIKAARPPWFEVGRQQDCSEFLRFVPMTV